MASVAAELQQLIDNAPGLQGDIYITAVSLTIVLCDWLSTFVDEIELIWYNQTIKVRILYAIQRYTVIGGMLFTGYVLNGLRGVLTTEMCAGWLVTLGVLGNITLILGNYTLIIQVYALWDYRKRVLRMLLCGFVVSYTATAAFSIYSIIQMAQKIVYVDVIVKSCVVPELPWSQIAVWGCQMSFDVFLLTVTFLNAAGRPVRVTVTLVEDLRRDGALYYLALFVLRLINIILCSFHNVSYFVLGYLFDFAMVNVIITRLILRIEHMRLPLRRRMNRTYNNSESQASYELHVLEVPGA